MTDVTGRFRLENLRPGPYAVRVTLEGWRVYERGGILLMGSETVQLDVVLHPTAPDELVVVTGELAPLDARSGATLGTDAIKSIPTARSFNAWLALVPGVVTSQNDTVIGPATTSFPIHGGRAQEGRLQLDGLNVGSPPSGNSATNYSIDLGAVQGVRFTTAAGLGEAETAGLVMNLVPRSGANTLSGSFFASGTGRRLQSDNRTPDLVALGVSAMPLRDVYDLAGTFGGPIRKDHAWYFVTARTGGSTRDSVNVFYNGNAGDPSAWRYAPDPARRAYSDQAYETASGRITWQLAPRRRFSAFWDAQALCRTCTGATPGPQEPQRVSPEAVGTMRRPLHVFQATWSSAIGSQWLLEAGYGGTHLGVGNRERDGNPTRDLVRVTEQCASGCAANGNLPGLVYRSQDFTNSLAGSHLWKGSLSHLGQAHTFTVGVQHTLMMDDRTWYTNSQNLAYRVNNGVPNQLTQVIAPWVNDTRVAWDAAFAQVEWAAERFTLHAALRFDYARSWFPEQRIEASRFLAAPLVIPETRGVDGYSDFSPRVAVAYDVSGRGRTAAKVSLGRYLEGAGAAGIYANTNPTLRVPRTTTPFGAPGVTRAWTDANANFVPDCDLRNPAAQDLRPSGGDACGALANADFGKATLTNSFDPEVLGGWGVRPSDWHWSASLQQRVGARSWVSATYTRRWYRGFQVADNRAVSPADLTPFTVVAPFDSRLPGGGGYTVSGLYDVVPEKFGQVDDLITRAERHAAWRQQFNGLDLTADVKVGQSLVFGGGTSTGQTVTDACAVRAALPEMSTITTGTSPFGPGLGGSAVTPTSPYCHVASGWLTQFRGFSSYMVPKIDLQLATALQSKPGAMLAANYAVPNADVAPSLGRNLSGNAANVTVNLIEPGTLYGDRINLLDVRIAKVLRAGRSRTVIALEAYNTLNSSAVLTYNNAFVPGGLWLQPITILTPRFVKLAAEVDF